MLPYKQAMHSNEFQLRQEIVKIGRMMYDKDFILASDGNISARLGHGRFLLTPSGLHKGLLEPDQLIIVNEAGKKIGGPRHLNPTSELPMHLEAYRQRPDVTAVVHAHPPYAVALSIAGISMADCLLPETVVFLGTIPTTAYATPSSAENASLVREFIGSHDGLVLQRHGSLTVGNSPTQAFMRLETLERNAFIGYLLAQLNVHSPMPPADVQKLLHTRQKLGLSRPGELEDFCQICGVCHPEGAHLNNVVTSQSDDTIREIVADVVQKTLGS